MRKAVAIFSAVAAVLVPSAVAQADSTNLPGGTTLSVEITSPADEGVVPAGTTTVAGTASIGEAAAVKDNDHRLRARPLGQRQ